MVQHLSGCLFLGIIEDLKNQPVQKVLSAILRPSFLNFDLSKESNEKIFVRSSRCQPAGYLFVQHTVWSVCSVLDSVLSSEFVPENSQSPGRGVYCLRM